MRNLVALSLLVLAFLTCSQKPTSPESADKNPATKAVVETPPPTTEDAAAAAAIQKIGEIKDDIPSHKAQALEEARDLLGTLELSHDNVIRKKELHAVISLAVLLLPEDETGELSDYIHDFHRDYPEDFDSVLQDTNKESRDLIKESLAASQKLFEHGEEENAPKSTEE